MQAMNLKAASGLRMKKSLRKLAVSADMAGKKDNGSEFTSRLLP
jgi:hypothetical protein